jgi:hypothetical protein
MHTKLREKLREHQIQEVRLPYTVTIIDYGNHKRYDKNPEGEDERQIGVHVMIYDDSNKYLWMGKGLTQKMQSGYTQITNENIPMDHAIRLAKLDAMRTLSDNCHGHESIYACFVKNPAAFLRRKENPVGTDREKIATGKVTIIEARTD